jgi:hypothetical protein
MRAACIFALSALLALGAGSLEAMEKASAKTLRERPTSTLEQVSAKPLFLFSMRGRLDPFMAYALLTNTAQTDVFNISQLRFNGLVEVQGTPVALFQDNAGKAFVLKGEQLMAPDGRPVEGIRGRVGADSEVALEQGERKIKFTAKRRSKRLDGPSQH